MAGPNTETEAVGPVAAQLERLKRSLAHCHYWRTFRDNEWSVEEAAERIYIDAAPFPMPDDAEYHPDEYAKVLPYILLYKAGSVVWTLEAETAGFTLGGQLTAQFRVGFTGAVVDNIPETSRQMNNLVGLIAKTGDKAKPGLAELSARSEDGFLKILRMQDDGPLGTEHNEQVSRGHELSHMLNISWGSVPR